MTRIDFYLLETPSEDRRLETVCRLIEKALKQKKSVFVHTDSTIVTKQLDTALWAFRPESFIPHRVLDTLASSATTAEISETDMAQTASRHKAQNLVHDLGATVATRATTGATSKVSSLPGSSLSSTSMIAGVQSENSVEERVDIGCQFEPNKKYAVLINLASEVPLFFSRFERALEVVSQNEEQRELSRKRYAFYKQRGYPMNHHELP